MLASIGIVVTALMMAVIEVPYLLRKRLKRELWAFSALLAFGTSLSILHVLKVPLPSPHEWIAFLYKPLSDVIYRTLQ
ncbi:hypothetical protein [Neobacillus kokaensis]|uniref:Uncharacterized protein n=1 Tax=Neobacillus kokaensis TaxID=2759023 RepID=A0ABQ3NB07_9BACI|nr:hypothetical protein [Neobacillus kokaensis]GHI01096.1 hypothetical protein AM1BK_46380 [Neobacillus kokaensis]